MVVRKADSLVLGNLCGNQAVANATNKWCANAKAGWAQTCAVCETQEGVRNLIKVKHLPLCLIPTWTNAGLIQLVLQHLFRLRLRPENETEVVRGKTLNQERFLECTDRRYPV